MTDYRRFYTSGAMWFFTVNLAERRSNCLPVEKIDVLRTVFRSVKARKPYTMNALVILPDHLHCIWTLPPDDADYLPRAGINSKGIFPVGLIRVKGFPKVGVNGGNGDYGNAGFGRI